MAGKLTRAQRMFLQTAIEYGGRLKVYPDQKATALALAVQGLITTKGRSEAVAEVTPAGRAVLDAGDALQAGGLTITEEMVERGARAVNPYAFSRAAAGFRPERAQNVARTQARACLEAALRPGGGE